MLRVWRALSLLALVAVQGCWLQPGRAPNRAANNDIEYGLTAANVADLEVRWTAQLTGAANEAVVDGGRAFLTSAHLGSGSVAAVDMATGAKQWSADISGATSAALIDGKLRVAGVAQNSIDARPCALFSFDPATGDQTVLRFGPGTFSVSGVERACTRNEVLAVGKRAIVPWRFDVTYQTGWPSCRLGLGFQYGTGVAALDLSHPSGNWDVGGAAPMGCVLLPQPPAPPPPLPWPPAGSLPPFGEASSDGTFVLVPQGQVLQAYPVDCGVPCQLAWSIDVGGAVVGPAVALPSGDLAVPRADGTVVVVDGTTHQLDWTAQVGAPLAQALAATPTTIFAVANDGTVAALPALGCGASTCSATWTATLGSPASARPSIGGEVLYVGSSDGTVTALPAHGCGASTCDDLWTGTTPGEVTGAPVVSSGTVLVGSADGTVTAFARPG